MISEGSVDRFWPLGISGVQEGGGLLSGLLSIHVALFVAKYGVVEPVRAGTVPVVNRG